MAHEDKSPDQSQRPRRNDRQFSPPFRQKTDRDLEEAHGGRCDPFKKADLAVRETQLEGDEGKKEIDRIRKSIINEVESAVREKMGESSLF